MRKWIILATLLAASLLAYAAAGPWLAIHGIGKAVREENATALAKHVDFPPLRASLRAQLGDRIVRGIGIEGQSGLLGAFGAAAVSALVGGAVDLMVTPVGLGALMEGRKVWNRASGLPPVASEAGVAARQDPLREAERRFESTSRFTATVHGEDGKPIVFVLTRSGLRWKLSDIQLPL
ncbi:MAG TPA: DUF2939 domain-containing protein [Luteimonas sp.]|nr:DUF2939 domain-containing protein [Luteimonas sp.]